MSAYKLEVGKWDKLPHFAVIGEPTSFYVWINHGNATALDPAQGASAWLQGREAFDAYYKLKHFCEKKKVNKFIALVEELHKSNRKRR